MNKEMLNALIKHLDKIQTKERLDPEIKSTMAKAVKEFSHGLSIKDLKKVSKSIDVLSKVFINL
jgi:hypothetical protein